MFHEGITHSSSQRCRLLRRSHSLPACILWIVRLIKSSCLGDSARLLASASRIAHAEIVVSLLNAFNGIAYLSRNCIRFSTIGLLALGGLPVPSRGEYSRSCGRPIASPRYHCTARALPPHLQHVRQNAELSAHSRHRQCWQFGQRRSCINDPHVKNFWWWESRGWPRPGMN